MRNTTTTRTRSWWGWGWEDEALGPTRRRLAGRLAGRFGRGPRVRRPARARRPRPARAARRRRRRRSPTGARPPRSTGPPTPTASPTATSCAASTATSPNPPDLVAFPPTEADVVALLDWCASAGVAAIPYGGGSSVVGGVECAVGDGFAGVVSIDLTAPRPGARGRPVSPGRPHPGRRARARCSRTSSARTATRCATSRSRFEFSTLGGWLATRSGGHYATVYTHIDDLVESMRVVTPDRHQRVAAAARLGRRAVARPPVPRLRGHARRHHRGVDAGAGPAPVQGRRPASRFADFADGVDGDAGASPSPALFPTNCRLLDPGEAAIVGRRRPTVGALLVLGFESADHPVDAWLERAVELCRDHGGDVPDGIDAPPTRRRRRRASREGAVGAWRNVVPAGAVHRATRSSRCGVHRRDVRDRVHLGPLRRRCTPASPTPVERRARARSAAAGGSPAGSPTSTPTARRPYFTVHRARAGRLGARDVGRDQGGGGRGAARPRRHDHPPPRRRPRPRPVVRRQRPEPFAGALPAAKRRSTRPGILNPGVIV